MSFKLLFMYSEISSILDTLFFKKEKKFITIISILLISVAITWFFSSEQSSEKERFVELQEIQMSQSKDSVEYGLNNDFFFALLPKIYFKIPKVNDCEKFDQYDFTTWCNESSVPQNYY